MSRIIHIECPNCGGTLGMSEVDRIVSCGYCGVKSLVDGPEHVPEYTVPPRLDKDDARRTLRRALRDKAMPQSLGNKSRFHSARLHLIPFHELSARRTGTLTVMDEKRQRGGIRGEDIEVTAEADTRVVMGDVQKLEPAVRLPGWALSEAGLARLRAEGGGAIQPADRGELTRLGQLHAPAIEPRAMLEQLGGKSLTSSVADNTEYGELRIKRIFYPVWRVRYRFQGRLYSCTVDGVTGEVMGVRAPQADRHRVLWLLGVVALTAFVVGKILRGIGAVAGLGTAGARGMGLVFGELAIFMLPVALALGAFLVLLLAHGWDQFRHPGELIIEGNRREVVKMKRGEGSALDRVFGVLDKLMSSYDDLGVRRDH